MLPTIKSELRKLFTIRSTYILIILSLALTVLFAFYFEGYRGNTGSPASQLAPSALSEIITNSAGLSVVFASIIAILFMAHEYRYNLITYTLTANAKRSRVLFVKLLTITIFSVAYGLLAVLFAIGSYMAGLSLRGADLPPQDLNLMAEIGKIAFYYMGYALIGIMIATIARSVVAAISILLIVPVTIEPLLGLVLKENSKYLPFTALDSTVGASISQSVLSPGGAIILTCLYLSAGVLVTWLLFLRRDAT